jgi:hypothetical protein
MKFNNERKNLFTTNSRINYESYNKSSIFDPVKVDNQNEVKKNIIKQRTKSTFIPKHIEDTAQNRKFKEIWVSEHSKERYSTIQVNNTCVKTEEADKKEREILSAKERKFQFLNPSHKIENLRKPSSVYEKSSRPETIDYDKSNARERRASDMISNIFNDPVKNDEILSQKTFVNFRNSEISKKFETIEPKKTIQKFKTKNSFKQTISPYLNFFSQEIKGDNKVEKFNSTERKIHFFTFFDTEDKKKMIKETLKNSQEEKARESIKNTLKENTDKANKILNLASSHHKNFYSQNYANNQEREIKNYEIELKEGYNTIEANEIKKYYSRSG